MALPRYLAQFIIITYENWKKKYSSNYVDFVVILNQGFQVLELIVDVENCLQAFFGVADDLDAIFIAFRTVPKHPEFTFITIIQFRYILRHLIPLPHVPSSISSLSQGQNGKYYRKINQRRLRVESWERYKLWADHWCHF